MNDLRTAAQQVLEACEQRLPLKGQAAIIDELNNLRTVLAQQPEPVQAKFDEVAVEQWKLRMVFYDENGEPLMSRQPEPEEIRAALAQQDEPTKSSEEA